MRQRTTIALWLACAATVLCAPLGWAGSALASPIKLLTFKGEVAKHRRQAQTASREGIVPPPLPCPQNGLLPPVDLAPNFPLIPNCGLPELPVATGVPYPGPMSYYGGRVQTHPHEYLVLWGWGEPGAFGARACHAERITEGKLHARVKCDPDGAARYMADFLYQMGGTQWANVQDQYYETTANGKSFINERGNLLAGMWVDDKDPGNLSGTNAGNPTGPTNTYTDMALEATRAAEHFHVKGSALLDANFIIAQPEDFSDPNAANSSSIFGYCAFHDYTLFAATGNSYYNPKAGVQQGIAYTNMPYVLKDGAGCGEGLVNGSHGQLDGFSMALGHEVEETATDPGSEDVVGNILTGGTTYYGGWYDELDGNENGDKCAYVGVSPLAGVAGPTLLPVPGRLGDIEGKRGGTFAVQSLWSDAAAGGLGWCAGIASTDLPGSLAGEPPYN
jgi:hypothetical protein